MATRQEALARAASNIQPGIDASRAQVATLDALVTSRVADVYLLPGVLAAQAQVNTWMQTLQERVAAALAAPAVQTPTANLQAARTKLATREANLAARITAINAYYDELERRAATQGVVDTPPNEAT